MKRIAIVLLFTFAASVAEAQLYGNKWRFGLSAGITNYVGDIRPVALDDLEGFTRLYNRYENYSEQFSYQASLEYALGNSVGIMLTAGSYQFGSADRFVTNDGTLLQDALNFDRALNFQTDIYDAGLSFVFKPDNNRLLSGNSLIAPYFTLGFGIQTFSVNGDLLDANGNRYDYSDPTLIPDGTFETNLNDLGTESPDGYEKTTFYANLGLGVRFRITKSIELFAQSDFKRTNTDYLDDVSGEYRTSYDNDFQAYAAKPGTNVVTPENRNRGFENGNQDWYIYHGVGIKFSFGTTEKSFQPPVISQRYSYELTSPLPEQPKQEEIKKAEPVAPSQTNYITVIQLPEKRAKRDISTDSTTVSKLDSAEMAQIQLQIDSVRSDSVTLNRSLEENEARLAALASARELAEADSSASQSVRDTRLSNLQFEVSAAETQKDSLMASQQIRQNKIDSLSMLLGEEQRIAVNADSVDYDEILIYPGEVTRIEYGARQARVLSDSSSTTSQRSATPSSEEMMTKEEFDEQLEKFRSDMLQAQAKRDSAMMMAFATKYQSQAVAESKQAEEEKVAEEEDPEETPQEIVLTQEAVDEKAAKKEERNERRQTKADERAERRQERLEEKNNELLKDALLVGGTAATTAAITSGKKDKIIVADTVFVQPDSILMARIASDSVLIDSLSRIPPVIDTVQIEKTKTLLLTSSKVEVYFDINSPAPSPEEIKKLEEVSEYLKANPDRKIELIGYADNTGSISYNLRLSEQRVNAVAEILKNNFGISEDRIQKESGGLILRGATKGSSDSDRKVEIRPFTPKPDSSK